MLTTKGRYAVMAIADLIHNQIENKPVKLQNIADRQNIPLNYLEQIFSRLKKHHIVQAAKGPGGGYQIAKPLDKISIATIINASEETTKMTRCTVNENGNGCMPNNIKCLTHDLWEQLGTQIDSFLSSISLEQLKKEWKI